MDRRDHGEEPDGAALWRWVGKATRPVVGWVLVGAGALVIVIGYLGVSRESIVAKQMPYLISGGVGGMLLVAVGAVFLATEDIRRDSGRLDRVEEMVQQLHQTLLTRSDAPTLEGDPASSANGARRLVTLPDSTSFHRADCAMVSGKNASTVAASTVRRRNLEPCALCEPSLADA
jgi:hypothetical protein